MEPSNESVRPLLTPVARLSLNALLVAGGVALVAYVGTRLSLVVLPTLIALLLTALLLPLADLLRRRLPSVVATGVSMLVAAGVVAGLFALVVPAVVDQIGDVGTAAREGLDRALTWLTEGPLDLDQRQIEQSVDDAVDTLQGNSGAVTGGVVQGATAVGEFLAGTALVLVLLFFFLHDGRRMYAWATRLLPERHRPDAEAIGQRVWRTLSGYVRGVIVIATVDALLIGLALVIIGVPLVVPLMALVFLGAFVPLIGAVLAGAVAALVALVSGGVVDAILVVVAITVIQQLEGDLLYPLVVGQAIDLHPVAILLVLTAGTVLYGLAGALLAVPVAAAAWTAIDHLRRRHERSAGASAAPS